MTSLDRRLKSRDFTLLTKVCLVKGMVFPGVMYGCESWTIKKIEHWRNDAFELWCWRRLFESPLDSGRLNQSILKEINLEYSLEGLMLKLKFQLGSSYMKSQLIGKDPDAGKDWRQKEKEITEDEMVGWHHWLNRHELERTLGDSEGQGSLACCRPSGHKEQTRSGNWTTTTNPPGLILFIGPRITVFSLPPSVLQTRWILQHLGIREPDLAYSLFLCPKSK